MGQEVAEDTNKLPLSSSKNQKELITMTIRRKIKNIVDGDTFKTYRKVRGTNYVRIARTNAPERGQRGYGPAKARLQRFVGKTVTLVPQGRSYNRVVADVRYKRRRVR